MASKSAISYALTAALALVLVSFAPPAMAAEKPCNVEVSPGSSIPDAVNRQPAGAVVCLKSGVHRVDRTISPKDNQTLRGLPGSQLVGSVALSRWQKDGSLQRADNVLPSGYSSPGECENQAAPLCRQAEALFANGALLTPVPSRDQVKAGTYFADYSRGSVFVLPPGGTAPAYELAKTRTAISSRGNGVRLERLTLKGFANLPQKGAIEVSGPNWVLSGNDISQNHGAGIMLAYGDNALITGNRIHSNGQLGIGQWRSQKARIEDNQILGNNTRGFWIADWEAGGVKITESSSTLRNNTIANNLGVGVWVDVAADGVSIIGNTISSNAADGVRFEISRNGEIRDNQVSGNALGLRRGGGTTLMSGAGINVNTASNVRVTGNNVSGNLNGIGIQMRVRGSGPWGAYKLQGIRVTGNTVDMTAPASPAAAVSGVVRASQVKESLASADVAFSQNTYIYPNRSAAKLAHAGSSMTFQAWQAAGFDADGRWLADSGAPVPAPIPAPPAPPAPTPAPPAPVQPGEATAARDDFSRSRTSGLGAAVTGGNWTTAGASSLYSVAAGEGRLVMSGPGHLPTAYLRSVSVLDADTTLSFSLDKQLQAGQVYVSVAGRSVQGVGEYRAKLVLGKDNGAVSIVRADSRGAETVLSGERILPDLRAMAGRQLNVRLAVTGASPTQIRLKVWPSGTAEPSQWLREAVDGTAPLQVEGSVGMLGSLSGNATGHPLALQIQDWTTLARVPKP